MFIVWRTLAEDREEGRLAPPMELRSMRLLSPHALRCNEVADAVRYNLTTPCVECPYLIGSGFTWKSLVAHASGEFPCHKACKVDDETGSYVPRGDKTPHCAGALIFLEKQECPHQMMRICERLGFYDRTKLDMSARVVSKPSECRAPSKLDSRFITSQE